MNATLVRMARSAGLRYVHAAQLDIARRRCGRGFTYFDEFAGACIRDRALRKRFSALAIPPAWENVRIARHCNAHLQAVGEDDAGRTQYLYHPDWRLVREQVKAQRLLTFGHALPRIRRRITADLKRSDVDAPLVTALACRLIDRTLLRPGHDAYARKDGGRGAASLLRQDVRAVGSRVTLDFCGKGGKHIEIALRDPLLARRLRQLKAWRGERLFVYRTGNGAPDALTAGAINRYLQEAAGAPVTAKDFRTFHASALAIELLAGQAPPVSKRGRARVLGDTMRAISNRLNNTPAIARASYVLPMVVDTWEAGALDPHLLCGRPRRGLSETETGLMRFLDRQVRRE